jgi:hypothetical protein
MIFDNILIFLMNTPLFYILRKISYIQLIYDNYVIDNYYINNYITNYYINRISYIVKEIIYHSLYIDFYYNNYFIENNKYTNIINKIKYLEYLDKIKNIEIYKKYSSVYEILIFKIKIEDCYKDDQYQMIILYPETNIITKKLKNIYIYKHCNIIKNENNINDLDIINKIIINKKDIDINPKLILTYYLTKYKCNEYRLGLLLNIPIYHLNLILDYKFIILINSTHIKKYNTNLNIFLDYYKKIIDKTKNILELSKINFNTKRVYYSILFNNIKDKNEINKKDEYIDILYNLNEYDFKNFNNINAFIDLITIIHYQKNYKELIKFIDNNLSTIKIISNNILLSKKIIIIIIDIIILYGHIKLSEILNDLFFNDIQLYNTNINKSNIILQKPLSITRKLLDSDNNAICIICLDNLIDNSIENNYTYLCLNCNKYVGHKECIEECLKIINKCPYCNL